MSALSTAPRAIVVAGALALALAGCTTPSPSSSTTQGSTSEAPTPTPSATSTQFPTDLAGTSVSDFTCDNLVQPVTLPKIAPGYTEIQNYEPDSASVVAQMQNIGGIACGYQDASGDIISFGYAKPSAASVTELIAYFRANSQPTTTYGDGNKNPGFFTAVGGYGQGDAFFEGYWVSVGSKNFSSPDDANGFIQGAEQDTPAG